MTIENEQSILPPQNREQRIHRGVQSGWEQALTTDQYEVAAEALGGEGHCEPGDKQRNVLRLHHFINLLKRLHCLINTVQLLKNGQQLPMNSRFNLHTLSPRVADLYSGLTATLDKSEFTPVFEMTTRQLEALAQAGDIALLQDPSLSWGAETKPYANTNRKRITRKKSVGQARKRETTKELEIKDKRSLRSKPHRQQTIKVNQV